MWTILALTVASFSIQQEPPEPRGGWDRPQDPRERMEQLLQELRRKLEGAESEEVRAALEETIRMIEEEMARMGPWPGPGGPGGPGGLGPPEGPEGPRGPGERWLISLEMENKIREFYAGTDVIEDLDWLKENSRPEEYAKALGELGHRTRDLHFLRERNPEEFDRQMENVAAEIHSRVLGARIQRAHEGAERTRLSQELRTLLGQLFDQREEMRRREIEELRRRLEELESQLTNRQANRQSIIDRKFAELTAREGELEW